MDEQPPPLPPLPPLLPPPPFTPEQYEALRARTFGASNPQRQANAVWEWMVRTLETPPRVCAALGIRRELTLKDPHWSFERYGATQTHLPDGRVLMIAGTHDGGTDPDFCIYNDVIVLRPSQADRARLALVRQDSEQARRLRGDRPRPDGHPDPDRLYEWGRWRGPAFDGGVEIYGYPPEVFPPTDFHTATLVGARVLLIGRLGYREQRTPDVTPVLSLDTVTLRITAVRTTGEAPGWIHEHSATLEQDGESIVIRGGKVVIASTDPVQPERSIDQIEDFRLWLADGRWERLTDRRSIWRMYEIRPAINDFGYRPYIASFRPGPGATWEEQFRGGWHAPELEQLLALAGLSSTLVSCGHSAALLTVSGVPVRIHKDFEAFRVRIEGPCPPGLAQRVVELIADGVRRGLRQEFTIVQV